jgi:type II secretory ATPase GspE/PulE/Tfp pilus assembly ATPase PilB-like protein
MDHTSSIAASPVLSLAEALILVSLWKPVLLLVPFLPWAFITSRVLDKHAARFFLERERWNIIHLSVALVAFMGVLSLPMRGELSFWLAFALLLLLLTLDIVLFAVITNKDERVPAEFHLTLDFSKWTAARAAKSAAKKQGKVELLIKSPDKSMVPPPTAGTPDFDVRIAAEAIITKAFDVRSTESVLAPTGKENSYATSHLIDGVRSNGDPMPAADAFKLMAFWKAAAKMDVADPRKKQQADINIERGETRKKIRVTSVGSQAGPRLSFLIDPESQVKRKLEAMGLIEPPQLAELKSIVESGQGLVLLAGGPDSGRTTTMYTIVKMHDAYTQNVQTIEFEVQDTIEGARQNKFDPQADGPELSTLIRSIIRRDPNVVAVAEIPDAASAKELARAEADRTRVYASLRCDSALAAIQMWLKLVGDAESATKGLNGIVAQKLLRKLCTNCRTAYQPSAEVVKKMGLRAESVKQLFKKGGQVLIKNKPEVCPVCSGVGYVGQEGVFEVYKIGEAERAMVKSGDVNALRNEWKKRSLPSIQQAAIRKALDGITSLEEVMRITAEPAAPKQEAKAS